MEEILEKASAEVAEKATEEAVLLQQAAAAGRHSGDGPEDVAEVEQDG